MYLPLTLNGFEIVSVTGSNGQCLLSSLFSLALFMAYNFIQSVATFMFLLPHTQKKGHNVASHNTEIA